MARKSGGRTGQAERQATWWERLIYPGIPIFLILAVLIWQWDNITDFSNRTVAATWALMQWGIIIVAIALLTLVFFLFIGRGPSLVLRWNRWLGGAIFLLFIWGILGFLDLGGTFGQRIIITTSMRGYARLVVLFLLA